MKVISVGLISLIIFNIVLAENSSDSEPTTGCFSFCRKKTKKNDKIDEPVENTGYNPDLQDIEFIDEFTPTVIEICKVKKPRLNDPFTSENDGTTVDKVTGFLRREYDPLRAGRYYRPYEEAFEKRNTHILIPFKDINEYNERVACNKALIHRPPPKIPEKQELPVEQKLSTTYGEDSSTLCKDTEETIKPINFMNETVPHLERHATGQIVQKTNSKYYNFDKYNEIITSFWNPDHLYFFDIISVETAKVEISEDKTIIVMTSANINDHNPPKRRIKKTFVNIAGCIVEKKSGYVDATYIESIDGHAPSYLKRVIRNVLYFFS
ncbi:hypothetical protein YYE_03499 [Plasmodium vinckei vinckei]|uniref:Fam-a protein n=1 Tax=Plasmodium vinckei vinckei TaxID=54757 RepID=A0A081ICJ5_PLAVN|nr:hypothetical protein YYE_03499 [Plasmodium vinckei vinckei]